MTALVAGSASELPERPARDILPPFTRVTVPMNDADRRIHPRHTFDRAVFCYHDGTRVAGKPIDISIGGMLFASPDARNVPKGTQMGVVFDRSCGIDPPVYLMARVVRFQAEPVEGIGLRWMKATTAMEARHLATFLEILFGISATILLPSIELGQGRMRSTFEFEAFLRAVVERKRAEQQPKAASGTAPAPEPSGRTAPLPRPSLRNPEAGPIGLITRPEEVDALRVSVVPHEQGFSSTRPTQEQEAEDAEAAIAAATGTVLPRRRRPSPPPAAGERALDVTPRERPVAADLAATLEIGTERLRVRITQLGLAALSVRTLVGPVDIDGIYPLKFSIATREGDAVVTATTRIAEVRTGRNDGTPGLELEIVDLDEAAHPGLVARYMKWLQASPHGRA